MDSDNDSYHSENEFYDPDEQNVLQENKNKLKMAAVKIQPKNCLQSSLRKKKINRLFSGVGRCVLGKTVPSVLSTALSLWPRAVLKTSATVFPNTDLPAGK